MSSDDNERAGQDQGGTSSSDGASSSTELPPTRLDIHTSSLDQERADTATKRESLREDS